MRQLSRSSRLLEAVPVVLGVALIVVFLGCNGPGSATAVLSSQIQNSLNQLTKNSLALRVINQASNTEAFDLLIDGASQTVSCDTVLQVCDTFLSFCPQTVETVRERKLDSKGNFLGGRDFNGAAEWTFTQGTDFQCGQTIIFKATDTTVTHQVL